MPSLGEILNLVLQVKLARNRAAELERLHSEATQYLAEMAKQEAATKTTISNLQAQLDKAQATRYSARGRWI